MTRLIEIIEVEPTEPPDGVYVVVGDGGKVYRQAAPDFDWELKDSPPLTPRDLLAIAWGSRFVDSGNGIAPSQNTLRSSADGDDPWTDEDNFDGVFWASSPSGMCYFAKVERYICVGSNSAVNSDDGFILTSSTGVAGSWTQRTFPGGGGWLQRIRCNDEFAYAVGLNGRVVWTDDGEVFHAATVDGGIELYGITYGEGKYLVVGEGPRVYTADHPGGPYTKVYEGPGTYVFLDVDWHATAGFFAIANGAVGVRGIHHSANLGVGWSRVLAQANLQFCYAHPDATWGGAYVGGVGGTWYWDEVSTWYADPINPGFTAYAMAIGFPA